MLTTRVRAKDRELALAARVHDLLAKPFDGDELSACRTAHSAVVVTAAPEVSGPIQTV